MRKRSPDPIPLAELPREHDLARLGPLVESATQEPPPGLPMVKWRVRSTLRRQAEWRRRALRVALVGVLLFLAGGVVGAVVQPVFLARPHSQALLPADPRPPTSPPRGTRGRLRSAAADPAPVEATSEAPPVPPVATAAPRTLPPPAPVDEAPSAVVRQPTLALRDTWTPSVRLPAPVVSTTPTPAVTKTATRALDELPIEPSPGSPVVARTQALEGLPAERPTRPPTSPREEARRIAYQPSSFPMAPPVPRPQASDLPSPSTDQSPSAAMAALPEPVQPKPQETPAPSIAIAAQPDEQSLLTGALRRLRVVGDPQGALALLDQHATRFPSGVLAPEAARLRTEALLLAGHKAIALAELDRQPFESLPSSDERRVLRGELRAAAGRWRAALVDFDAVVGGLAATHATADLKSREVFERALWGRASARSHLADQTGARADLVDYLRRFPSGRFAAEAARLVGDRR